jgi:hypothetical protein
MKRLLTIVLMALAFVTTSAISAFCANVAGEVSGLSCQPLSGVQLSLTNHPLQILAQAGSTNTLVSDGLLKPVAGSKSPQTTSATDSATTNSATTNSATTNTGVTPNAKVTPVPGCKNGQAEGNKHCVPSSSE